MGAWGAGPFENDGAGDWEASLDDAKDLAPIVEVIESASVSDDEYLEVDIGQQVMAASEALSVLLGRPDPKVKYPDRVTEWAKRCAGQKSDGLPVRAAAAIDRILGENSEFNELWAETDDYQAVVDHATSLKSRLLTKT